MSTVTPGVIDTEMNAWMQALPRVEAGIVWDTAIRHPRRTSPASSPSEYRMTATGSPARRSKPAAASGSDRSWAEFARAARIVCPKRP